jgi:hypothetical protein
MNNPIQIGTQVTTLHGENNSDEYSQPRHTAPNSIGTVEHIDTDIRVPPGRDPLYHVIFPNGAWIILDTSEITRYPLGPQLYTISVATISSGLRRNSCDVIHHTPAL